MDTATVVDREARAAQRLLHFIIMIQSRNICGLCNLHFLTRVDLNEHMQQHTGVSYTCDCCNVICSTWPSFQEHWLIHRNMVFCPYCYKVHTNYWRLNLHWRMHGKKISLCPYCGRVFFFIQIKRIIMDLRLHTEPFECDSCYNTFKTLSDLRNHHLLLHHEIPFDLPFRPLPEEREE